MYSRLWRQLWLHSVSTALTATWLAPQLHVPPSQTAFLGGLLHDIGKMVALDALGTLIREGRTESLDEAAVAAVLEVVHIQVGAETATACRFPLEVTEICRNHHEALVVALEHRESQLVVVVSTLDEVVAGLAIEALQIEEALSRGRALGITQNTLRALAKKLRDSRTQALTLIPSA